MDSDDSDFYGDATTVSHLRKRVNNFDIDLWAQQQRLHPGRPQQTVDDFLRRLPPATTDQTNECPWIFICNPYIRRVHKQQSESQFSKGNENEAPEEEGSKIELITAGGLERLHLITEYVEGMERSGKRKPFIEKEVGKERKKAVDDILHLAHLGKVRTGKWMLFCSVTEVNEVWEIVVKATANNELGIAAKVAPRSQTQDPRKDRLLCVYTADFADKVDVKRVLQKLRELKLVETRSRPIYYKPDAFTYIGISSGNPWGVRASIYSSTDVFLS
ncbi:UPF0696C11orf68-like protein [Cladobotryum mycophilum]|uniref:UPF0696C11orf68-like protein n=1 Tax=Cladobotryum mycophilum TaxID=491253 RepID=A0ABR0SUG3_9HYPO